MEILVENITWIFSGIGVSLLGAVLSKLTSKNKKEPNQKSIIVTIDNNVNILEFSLKKSILKRDNKG